MGFAPIRSLIYSFHMPLFFILSSWTSRYSSTSDDHWRLAKKSYKHLIVPALWVFLVGRLLNYSYHPIHYSSISDYAISEFLRLLYASVVPLNLPWLHHEVPDFGILYFLVALFFSRIVYDRIQINCSGKKLMAITAVVSSIGAVYGQICPLPFSFDIALAVVFYMFMGNMMKQYNQRLATIDKKSLIRLFAYAFVAWIVLWAVVFLSCQKFLDIGARSYPLFPISYIGGIAGTLFVVFGCRYIERYQVAYKLAFIGKYSLYLLIIHHFDALWIDVWQAIPNKIAYIILRVLIDLGLFYAFIILKNSCLHKHKTISA